jgi:hypothetical protein
MTPPPIAAGEQREPYSRPGTLKDGTILPHTLTERHMPAIPTLASGAPVRRAGRPDRYGLDGRLVS